MTEIRKRICISWVGFTGSILGCEEGDCGGLKSWREGMGIERAGVSEGGGVFGMYKVAS
jgi:hypothetical protein